MYSDLKDFFDFLFDFRETYAQKKEQNVYSLYYKWKNMAGYLILKSEEEKLIIHKKEILQQRTVKNWCKKTA